MELIDGSNGCIRRDVIFRPIQFERYRKPSVVSYPRQAKVLNPHHTKEVTHRENGNGDDNNNNNDAHETSSDESGASDTEDTDDDDPLNLEDELKLCRNEQLRQLLHLRWLETKLNGCGLQNMGNTCYINCVLQAIAYTPALAQYFSHTFKAPYANGIGGGPYDYAFALGDTVRSIHCHSHNVYRPSHIISQLKSLYPHFRQGRQGDAHEFLLHLLDACHKSILFRQIGSKKVPFRIEQTSALRRVVGGYLRSVVAWSRQEEIHRLTKIGKVQEAADLRLRQRGRGDDVMTSKTYDPFVTLSVDVTDKTLDHCLEKLFEKERLDGHSYISPRGVGVKATKHFQFHTLPPVLIIHTKRFNSTGAKVCKFIQYPLILDLSRFFTVEDTRKKSRHNGMCGNDKKHSCLYELNAICIHEGCMLSYGHYYTVARARNGAWLLCNDERVSYCKEEWALKQQAYMLFYSRVESSPSSSAATTRKDDKHASEMLDKRNKTTKLPTQERSMAPILQDDTERNIGRSLSEEEVARILKEKREAKQQQKPESTTREEGKEQEKEEHNIGSNGKCKHSSSSSSAAAPPSPSSSSSPSGSEDDNDTNNHHHRYMSLYKNGNIAKAVNASPHANGKSEANGSHNGTLKSRYGGIVKAMRHSASHPMTSATPSQTKNGEERENGGIVGRRVVDVVEAMRQSSTPGTVARPRHAPKFCQSVRDEMWEREMDRGRVKRVRTQNEEFTGENKFQKADIAFDSRGRRYRKG